MEHSVLLNAVCSNLGTFPANYSAEARLSEYDCLRASCKPQPPENNRKTFTRRRPHVEFMKAAKMKASPSVLHTRLLKRVPSRLGTSVCPSLTPTVRLISSRVATAAPRCAPPLCSSYSRLCMIGSASISIAALIPKRHACGHAQPTKCSSGTPCLPFGPSISVA
jgi:hypothetical protein